MDRAEFLQATDESHRGVLARTEGLDDEQFERPGASGWSAHDLLGHLAVWYDTATERAELISAGKADQIPAISREQLDAINDAALARDRALSPAAVRQRYQTSYDQLLAALRALPDAAWTDEALRDVIDRRLGTPAYRHAASHLGDL